MPDRFEVVREEIGGSSLADFVAASVRRGEYDIDSLAMLAPVVHWAWEALREVAPERAAEIKKPDRRRGRTKIEHAVRNIAIRAEVKARMAEGASLRAACKATVAGYPALTSWTTIAEIWRKRTRK